jgi:hypothetical protein
LRAIDAFDIDSHLAVGKKSCTVVFDATGKTTSVKADCLYSVCVNLTKRSFYIYGGSAAAGNIPSKRNHCWSKTGPQEVWATVFAVMSEHFIKPAEQVPPKRRRTKGV